MQDLQDRALLYASQFFAAVSKKSSIVFYLDDLHWADDESLNFLDFITRECAKEAILITEFTRPILFERRPHWGEGKENRIFLNLQHLTKRESGKLIGSILQKVQDVPKDLLELLVSKTEGNPFYLEELIKMFIDQEVINTKRDDWFVDSDRLGEINVPTSLTGVLQSRLDKLSFWEKRILQRASVVGREFWDNLLKKFESEINVPTVLESLRRKELLFRKENSAFEDANEYIFKHALLQDVTYETILLEERRTWHLETAQWLIQTKGERRNEYFSVIAEHFEKAGEIESSALWYGKAGQQARKSFALESAEKFLVKALKFWQNCSKDDESALLTSDQISKWKHSLGVILRLQLKYSKSIEVFTELLEMAKLQNSKLNQAYANWGLSCVQFESGEVRNSLESAKETARLAGDDDLDGVEDATFLRLVGLYRHGRSLVALGEFVEAIAIAKKALELFTGSGKKDLSAKANVLHLLALANMCLGRFKEAQKFEQQEVEISRELGDFQTVANGLNSLGFQSYMQGKGKEAIEYYEDALEIARENGNKSTEIMILSNISGARVYLGEYEKAEIELKQLINRVGETRSFLVPEMYRFLTETLIGQGKFNEALETAKRSLALSQEAENQEMLGEIWRVLGVVSSCLDKSLLIGGKQVSASDCFQESLNIFEKMGMEAGSAQTLHNFAQDKLAKGNFTEAEELLSIEREISTRLEIDTKAKNVYFQTQS